MDFTPFLIQKSAFLFAPNIVQISAIIYPTLTDMSAVPGAFGKRFNCPCCKNPWNQEENESVGSILCTPCLADDKGYTGIDPANFDAKVSPKENFYLWSNGGWREANPIPLEYSSWNTFIVLRDLNLERLKTLLDELSVSSTAKNEKTAKLADYYNSFMDETTIDAKGLVVLENLFKTCDNAKVRF